MSVSWPKTGRSLGVKKNWRLKMNLEKDDWQLTLDQLKNQIVQATIHLHLLKASRDQCEAYLDTYPKDEKKPKKPINTTAS